MLSYLKGWSAPHIKSLIAQTPSETILLSHIYERCLSCRNMGPHLPIMHCVYLPALALCWQCK